jgi:GTPase SAR1 and related small G proteins
MEESEGFSEILKGKNYTVVLIGASNVGKTALVYRYVLDELPPNFTSTIGVEFTKRIVFDKASGQKIQLHI